MNWLSPENLFWASLVVTTLGYLSFTLRSTAQNQPFVGHSFMLGLIGYAGSHALIATYQLPTFYTLFATSAHLVLMQVFLHRLLIRRINIPSTYIWTGVLATVVMLATPFSPLPPGVLLMPYAFAGLLFSLVLLLYGERLYHVMRTQEKRHGALLMGVSALALSHFATFCDLVLSPSLSMNHALWITVSIMVCFPFLYKGLFFLQARPLNISISRPMVFHATIFSFAGIYLLAMSGLGAIAQSFNWQWGYTSQVVMVGATAFPILYAFSSVRWRRQLMVFINKHLFSAQFDYRDAWLTLNKSLNPNLHGKEAASQGLRTILHAIQHPEGGYYRRAGGGWDCAAEQGYHLEEDALYALGDITERLAESGWVTSLDDAFSDPESYSMFDNNNALNVLKQSGVRWIIPVREDGQVVSVWLLCGPLPDWTLNWETRDFINTLAQQLESYLQAQSTRQSLSEHAQLAAFNQTSAFVIHDVKNIYAQISMINTNAKQHAGNPEFVKDAFDTLNSVEGRLRKTLDQLTNKQRSENPDKGQCRVSKVFSELQSAALEKHGITPTFTWGGSDDDVITHLIDNAIYACHENDTAYVNTVFNINQKCVTLTVIDDGVGMSQEFIEQRLFKPFETTKGNAGIGLGVYDAKTFSEKLGGKIHINSEVGQGTQVILQLPRSGAI